MTGEALSALIGPVVDLAADAGRRIMEVYRREFSISHKEDLSPLTEADMAAHDAIFAGLAILSPELPVLSEEDAAIPFAEREKWRTYWLVDPLDGTREFIKRNGEFTVNIALIQDHRPVLGVVHVPVSDASYYAYTGGGACKQEPGKAVQRIHTRPYRGGRITVAGSQSHRSPEFDAFLARLGEGNYEVISIGSSLKSCLVAEGKVDIYPRLGPTSEWDTAAAQCVVEEAGGRLTDTALRPLRYNTKDSLLNPHFLVFGDAGHDWSKYVPESPGRGF
ncbi:MAG: 3'(2'),5'-bisphosphate nucleotidase CysQ [Gammaproteobacteria bacterium]|nr:3'(2'),5'-bisphosphate nucleotidase CysQ [Gammaproteobacteria bacterium]